MRRIAVLLAWLCLAMPINPAAAHADFVSMTPSPGSTVGELSVVTLTFSEDITPLGSTVVVLDPNGQQIEAGIAVQGAIVSVSVNPPTVTGQYTVNYRVVSVDAHVVEGSQSFTFEGSIPLDQPMVIATPNDSTAVAESASGLSMLGTVLMALAAGIAMIYFLLRRRP